MGHVLVNFAREPGFRAAGRRRLCRISRFTEAKLARAVPRMTALAICVHLVCQVDALPGLVLPQGVTLK